MSKVLVTNKLSSILKQFGEYPQLFRSKIWEHILQLPHNTELYHSLRNLVCHKKYDNLDREYPLFNKISLKNLKMLLKCLIVWWPLLNNVHYLPAFVYPFMKIYETEPVLCFEAVATILVNWCQDWFEYYPLPPTNILAMIENVFLEHDVELLNHLTINGITSELYGWPLLETAFSEILKASDWCIFWDHVLTNEPSFLLLGVVAYNILQRTILLNLNDMKELCAFYHRRLPLNIKQLLSKVFFVLYSTSKENHPRTYLNSFIKLIPSEYIRTNRSHKILVKYDAANEQIKYYTHENY